MIHQIKRPSTCKNTNPSIYAKKITELVRELDSISPGDTVKFKDGEFVGYVVNHLSDPDHIFPENALLEITKSGNPELKIIKKPIRDLSFLEGRRAYSSRKVIDSEGHYSEQALVISFGSPAWINIGYNEVIVKAE